MKMIVFLMVKFTKKVIFYSVEYIWSENPDLCPVLESSTERLVNGTIFLRDIRSRFRVLVEKSFAFLHVSVLAMKLGIINVMILALYIRKLTYVMALQFLQ